MRYVTRGRVIAALIALVFLAWVVFQVLAMQLK